MASTTVRLNRESWSVLRELAEKSGESMQQVLAEAIEQYRRRKFLEEANVAYAALRADPKAWEGELEERRVLEGTLMDGLEDDQYPLPPAR